MMPAWLTDTVTSDLDRAIHYTLLWGLEGVELRTVGGPGDRVPFVNESKLKRRLAEYELPVVSVIPGMFEGAASDRLTWMNELAAFEEVLAFCDRIGCTRVVVSGFSAEDGRPVTDAAATAFRRAGDAAGRRGVTLAVSNEWSAAHATGRDLAALLEAVEHPSVRAAWAPASALRAGEDPMDGLMLLGDRVSLVRCADGTGSADSWRPALLGEGDLDWPSQLRQLRSRGFDGPVSLEVDVSPRPRHGLEQATRMIEMLRDAIRSSEKQS